MNQKLTFSGHETFACKQFWLKKAYDFASKGNRFSADDAVVTLGVGKNMVASLRYWSKAFALLQEDDGVSEFAEYLFGENGRDIFLEDIGSLWLLHYHILYMEKATIYSLFFNEFRRERSQFTRDNLHSFLKRKCEEQTTYVYNQNTINTDIKVFLQNYVRPEKGKKLEIEDDFSCIFIDLNLIQCHPTFVEEKMVNFYRIEEESKAKIPIQVFLYCILKSFSNQSTISLYELLTAHNAPGLVFCLSMAALYDLIQQAVKLYPEVVYSETAGNQILQIKDTLTLQRLLNDYYRN